VDDPHAARQAPFNYYPTVVFGRRTINTFAGSLVSRVGTEAKVST
jgi:hypothetical protein